MSQKLTQRQTTTTTSGSFLHVVIPTGNFDSEGAPTYVSRKIAFNVAKDAINNESKADKGYFETEAELIAAYPVGEPGWYCIVGESGNTFWTWKTSTSSWGDTTLSGVVLTVNGQGGTVTLTGLDIPFSSTQGLSATTVSDGIDEVVAYVDSAIAGGAGGAFINATRAANNVAVSNGDTPVTFSDPFLTTDYTLVIYSPSGNAEIKPGSETVNGFEVTSIGSGAINYVAVSNSSTGSLVEADDIGYDNTTSGLTAENMQDALDEAVAGAVGDMTKAVYDPTTVEGDAFDMDNMVAGTTNKILTTAQQNIDGDKDFQDEISVSKRSKSGINAISYALTVSVDFAAGDVHEIAQVTGNLTVNTTNVEDGQTGAITFTIDATGGYTIASGSGTWQKYDDSAYDFADCNVASTEYHVFYFIRNSTIYYSIQAITP